METQKPFSLTIYLLIVVALSWPFQIAYAVWGTTQLASYLLSSISMVMVTIATFIAGRYIFRDGFKNAGWSWGKPSHYIWVFGLALFIFLVPTLLEPILGLRVLPAGISIVAILGNFLLRFIGTLIPGLGEEFGWRGYMLPHLARRYSPRKALLIHSFIWWFWHLPVVIAIGVHEEIGATLIESIILIILITLIPSMMNAVIYAYVWTATKSLAVSSVYHSAFDEVRDAIEKSIGFGPLVSIWEMAATTIIGAILLWKGNWKPLISDADV
jgi:membrane protease YdiL (CAAX protease family)